MVPKAQRADRPSYMVWHTQAALSRLKYLLRAAWRALSSQLGTSAVHVAAASGVHEALEMRALQLSAGNDERFLST